MCEQGGYVIGTGVHRYIYIICLWTKQILNRTLAIDSPFQTFAVGLLIECVLQKRFPRQVNEGFSYLALFVRMDDTIIRTNACLITISYNLWIMLKIITLA